MPQVNFTGLPHTHLKLDLCSVPAVNDRNTQPCNVVPCHLQTALWYGIGKTTLLLGFHIPTWIFLFPSI